MPKYDPIDIGISLRASESDLVNFQWSSSGIVADFIVPGNEDCLLRIRFERQCIVRLLDEMPLSTESDRGPNEGLVPEHFAYRLEEGVFAEIQSDTWKMINAPVCHYQFITGWTCMDVISAAELSFSVVDRSRPFSLIHRDRSATMHPLGD
jgi:hypothetical protein